MKGLLYKDFLLLWKNCKSLLLIALLYIGLSAFGYSGQRVLFIFLACLMVGSASTTLISVDERDKWNIYSDALPVSRGMYVSSKYILTLAGLTGLLALSGLVMLLGEGSSSLGMLCVMWVMSFGIPALMMPVMFWLGAEKGRIANMIVSGLVAGGSSVIVIISVAGNFDYPAGIAFGAIPWTAGLVSTALFFLSWPISMKLYEKREF